MTDVPGDAQVKSVVDGAPAVPVVVPPGDAPGKNAQPTIKVGDKVFAADDVTGILNAKTGLEAENKAIKAKLEAYETEKLSEKEKLEKQIKAKDEENATLKQAMLNTKVGSALAAKGVTIKPELLNLNVTDESQIENAVQKLISENPGLVTKPGQQFIPPGHAAPPGNPPGATDKEAELMERYSRAVSKEDLAAIDKEYYELRGIKPPEVKKSI